MTSPLLSCSRIEGGYGGVQVLFGVDLEVATGETVALLGTNGAGKSTLLKIISGLLKPTGGSVVYAGADITGADAETTARQGIAHIPGGRGVFPNLSVAQNLQAATWLRRKNARHVRDTISNVFDLAPVLSDRRDIAAGDLSGGQQQLLSHMMSLGQALAAPPRLLLVDELSLNLDPSVSEGLIDLVRIVAHRGTAVVFVDQSVAISLKLAERAVFMEKGEVTYSGPTGDLLHRPDILRAVFLQHTNAPPPARRQRTPAAPKAAGPHRGARPVVLSTEDLTKSFGGVTAIEGFHLDLHDGEVLGLVGPNGAGKTTALDLISGAANPDRGRVRLGSLDITKWPAHRRSAAGVGRSFQGGHLWPGLTVTESISVALHHHLEIAPALPTFMGLPAVAQGEAAIKAEANRLIDFLNLGAYRDKFVFELSTGTRRVVELACLLALRPKILLLDEPSSGIAQSETDGLAYLIRCLRDELGCSILIIEHDMGLIRMLTDRLIGLVNGHTVTCGPPDEVLNHPILVAAYLGRAPDARRDP